MKYLLHKKRRKGLFESALKRKSAMRTKTVNRKTAICYIVSKHLYTFICLDLFRSELIAPDNIPIIYITIYRNYNTYIFILAMLPRFSLKDSCFGTFIILALKHF